MLERRVRVRGLCLPGRLVGELKEPNRLLELDMFASVDDRFEFLRDLLRRRLRKGMFVDECEVDVLCAAAGEDEQGGDVNM